MIDGNTAAALGCVYAGATVGAWYPITPSTSLMDAFKSFCERFRKDPESGEQRYCIVQAEDELAAIGMVLGAGWNGARAFTPRAGPGISLMSEFIGLAYYAEIPAVLFDVQRVGPSTGMPTRTQQGDILICAYASHGDTRHVLPVPGRPARVLRDGGRRLRPRRAPADAGVRAVRPRHRHERLDGAGARPGTTPTRPTAARCCRRGAAREDRQRSTATSTWTATASPTAPCPACHPKGRLLHPRLRPQQVRAGCTEDVRRVPGRGGPPAAANGRPPPTLVPKPEVIRAKTAAPWGILTVGSCDGACKEALDAARRARHRHRLHARARVPVLGRRSRNSSPATSACSWSSRTATRSCAACW